MPSIHLNNLKISTYVIESVDDCAGSKIEEKLLVHVLL
jgi:hypothetical protein